MDWTFSTACDAWKAVLKKIGTPVKVPLIDLCPDGITEGTMILDGSTLYPGVTPAFWLPDLYDRSFRKGVWFFVCPHGGSLSLVPEIEPFVQESRFSALVAEGYPFEFDDYYMHESCTVTFQWDDPSPWWDNAPSICQCQKCGALKCSYMDKYPKCPKCKGENSHPLSLTRLSIH